MSKQYTDDEAFAQIVHERWIEHRNRDLSSNSPEKWYIYQCYNCAFFVRLCGALYSDWGACSNGNSEFDGSVMFEHDGCAEHKLVTVQFSIVEYARSLLEKVDNSTSVEASSGVAGSSDDGE